MNPCQREYSVRRKEKSILFVPLFLMGLILWTVTPSFSQPLQIHELFFTDAQVFYLSDFDVLNMGNSPLLFQISISSGRDSTYVTFKFELIAQRYQDSGGLIEAKTKI